MNKNNIDNAFKTLWFIRHHLLVAFKRMDHRNNQPYDYFDDPSLHLTVSFMKMPRFFNSLMYMSPGTIISGGWTPLFLIVPFPIICATIEIVVAVARAMAVMFFSVSL